MLVAMNQNVLKEGSTLGGKCDHVYHIYTDYHPNWKMRMYWAECECGWKSGEDISALECKREADKHAPGAEQFEPYG